MSDPTTDDSGRAPDPDPPRDADAHRHDRATDARSGDLTGGTFDLPADELASAEDPNLREREAQLRAYARLLDSAVRLPGGFRIGLDGIVGLVPVVGDLAGLGLSSYLVFAAARLGVRRSVLARMAANVALESAVGVVPIVGDAFDFVFKANERNVRLLERELASRETDRAPVPPDDEFRA